MRPVGHGENGGRKLQTPKTKLQETFNLGSRRKTKNTTNPDSAPPGGCLDFGVSSSAPLRLCGQLIPLLPPLFLAEIADGFQHRLDVRCLFQGGTKIRLVQHLGNFCERVEMFLELTLGHEE
jgi:hypothetical protein